MEREEDGSRMRDRVNGLERTSCSFQECTKPFMRKVWRPSSKLPLVCLEH